MDTSTPEHDALCEGTDYALGLGCRCAERAKADGPIDPTLLKIRVKRVRQAEAALAAVKRTLVTYVTEHAADRCEWETETLKCDRERDGILLFSCGHSAVMCAPHGSSMLRFVQLSRETMCTKTDPDLHAGPVHGVTLEWCGL